MADQNPFSSYSIDDQNSIADQLRTAQSSGKLNSAQQQGVQNALKYLPISKEAAADQIEKTTTLGLGTWKPQPSLQFGDLSPEAHQNLGDEYTFEHRPRMPGWVSPKIMQHPGALVNQARQDVISMGGDAAAIGTERFLNAQRRDLSKPIDPDILAVAKATTRFGGEMASDPLTYATFLLPGSKAVTGAFAAQGAIGTYEAATQLHEVWDRQDVPRDRKIELGTNMVLNAFMSGMAAHHTVRGFLDTTALPLEDKVEIQQKIESEWQQMPNGKMIRRNTTGTTTSIVPDTTVAGGKLSQQFPEGSFFNRQIAKASEGEIPLAPRKPDRNVIRPLDAQAPEGRRDVSAILGRNLIIGNKPPPSPVEASAPPAVAGFERPGGPANRYVGRYNTLSPETSPELPTVSGAKEPTGVLSADELKSRQAAAEGFHGPTATSTASGLEEMMMMGGTLSHKVLEPKSVSGGTPEKVSTTEASVVDTGHYAKAKAEWMEQNPGVSPDKGISWIARRSNEIKTGQVDPTLQPSASRTPVNSPVSLTPREKADLIKPDRGGVYDLRTVDSDTRHEWINQNAHLEPKVANAAEMMREGRKLYGPDRHIGVVSYLDKDGALHHAIKLFSDEKGQPVMHVQPANAEDVSRLDLPSQKLFETVQSGESKFNEMTGGKHSGVLDQLWNATKITLPDSSHSVRLNLYNKGLSVLLDAARNAKNINDFQRAFDIVTKKSEGGFANPFGKQRISDADAKMLAKVHADTVLKRWEALSDTALKSRKVEKKLEDPALRNSVYGAKDASLESRYENLLDRSSKLRASDPIASLGTTLDGHSITERDIAAGGLREAMGTANRSREMRTKALQAYRDEWRSRPISDTIKFLDSVENGDLQAITDPRDRALASKLRDLLDSKRDEIRDLGREIMRTRVSGYDKQISSAKSPEQASMWQRERDYIQQHLDAGETSLLNKFYENYFPHMWRYGIKDMATNLMQGRRPFAPRNFLKQRTYQTFTEGIADGMEPITYNPIDMVLLKLHEMARFATAHKAFNTVKDMGLAHIFSLDQVPDGWTKVNDNMFNAGQNAAWYMPADAARPFNRHLGPGFRGNILYDTIAHYNNLVNQFNLGMSAFHGVETGVNAIASRFGLGIVKLSRGNIAGFKDIALSPLAPIMAPMEGRRVAAQYLDPSRYAQYEATADAVRRGNGRVRMPSEYSNQAAEAFRSAWKEAAFAMDRGMPGRALSKGALGTFRSIGALMEQVNKPIMEWQVPSTKLGVFHWMAQDILERMPADASSELLNKEFGYAWDRVDDRFGQVVYDNLFWNRMAKDMSHLLIRSVGWNYGDIRELGGAVWDLRDKEALKAAVTGKGITQKQGYVLGLLAVTGMTGYILNHAYGQKIDNPVTDLLYPKNGKMNPDGSPQRIYLKTYVHDAYQFTHAPGETTLNKMAPLWHQIGEMYKNADYYGTQIHPIHATTGDALTDPQTYTDTGKFLLDQAAPFSLRNFQQRRAQGESFGSALSSTAAILPAPKWVGQSKAELLAYELFKTKLGQGPNDQIKTESVRRYHELASGYAANRFTAKDVSDAFKRGEITAKQLDGILDEEEGKLSPLERHVKQLEPHEFLRVWDTASAQEKAVLQDSFLKRWDTLDEKYPAQRALELTKKFQSEWQTFQRSKQSN